MTAFWFAVAVLIVAGGAFFLPVLLGRFRTDSSLRSRWNLLIHHQRRNELTAEANSSEQAEQLAAEVDRELLHDLDASSPIPLKPASTGRRWLSAGLVASFLLGIGVYFQLGRIDLLQTPPAARDGSAMPGDLSASITQLAERLAKNPNDLEGWALLGRSLQATGQPDRAATAYEFALRLAPEDLDLKAAYAQTLAEAHQGSLTGKPAEIIAEILREDPAHQTGLWLAGLAAAERRNIPEAVAYWQKLKAQLPPGSEEDQSIEKYIAQVKGLANTPKASEKPGAVAGGANIHVRVTLAEKLKSQASPDDTVFIFARAASGPPMPLAVVRKRVRDLPAEVTLNDAMAMMPDRKLSSFDQIVIGARISKTGQPVPSPGDFQGFSKPVPAKSTPPQTIEIREIVR